MHAMQGCQEAVIVTVWISGVASGTQPPLLQKRKVFGNVCFWMCKNSPWRGQESGMSFPLSVH